MRNVILFSLISLFSFTSPTSFASFSALPDYEYQFQGKGILGSLEEADLKVSVKDLQGQALAGALVLVGSAEGVPFVGNKVITDEQGQARFKHESLKAKTPVSVTVSKAGFGNFTVVGNTQADLEIRLQAHPDERAYGFLQGKVHGFPPGYNKKTMEIGLFLPAFRAESLLNFDPQEMVSSYKVEMDVYGKRMVPGNVVLPPQDKSYGIIPIHLEKPEFIMPLPKGFTAHMSASVGAVGISAAVDAIRKKDFLTVINLTNLTHVNFTDRFTVKGDERFDITANQALQAKAASSTHQNIPAKLDLIAITMLDPKKDRGDFIPLDVKSLKQEEIKNGNGNLQLALLQQRRPDDAFYVFSGIFDRNQFLAGSTRAEITTRAIAGMLAPVQNNQAKSPGYMKLIQSQGVSGENREYRFSSPANEGLGLRPNLLLINLYSEKKNEITQGVTRKVLWSSLLPGNATSLSLPNLGTAVLPAPDNSKEEKFFWQVVALKTRAPALESTQETTDEEQEVSLQNSLREVEHLSTLIQKF